MPVKVHLNLQSVDIPCGMSRYETEITRRLKNYDDIELEPSYVSMFFKNTDALDFPVKRIKIPSPLVFRGTGRRAMLFKPFNIFKPFYSYNFLSGGSSDDVYVFFENKIPDIRLKGKIVVVVHDIIPLRVNSNPSRKSNDHLGKRTRYVTERNTRDILKKASQIIVDSEFTRKDLADYFDIDPSGIEVIYCGINSDIYSRKYDLLNVREKYNLPEKYILYFGACAAHKNVETLIRAYSKLPESLRREYKLVITNPVEDITDCANDCKVSDYVHYIRAVPESDKPAIYQMASLFVWPSFYEGFGLPVLEAMSSGVPVVCSNVTSMPEVAGDAAVLVDPLDDSGMAHEIERVLCDENLRKELIAKGYENIKRFSWDDSAKKFHDIITGLQE